MRWVIIVAEALGVVGFIVLCLVGFAVLCFSGCIHEPSVINTEDAGTFVDATMVSQESFTTTGICRVETTRGVFLIPQYVVSGTKGEKCTIVNQDNGNRYLWIGGRKGYLFETE